MQPILNDLGISLKMGDLSLNNEKISDAIKRDSDGTIILVNIKGCLQLLMNWHIIYLR